MTRCIAVLFVALFMAVHPPHARAQSGADLEKAIGDKISELFVPLLVNESSMAGLQEQTVGLVTRRINENLDPNLHVIVKGIEATCAAKPMSGKALAQIRTFANGYIQKKIRDSDASEKLRNLVDEDSETFRFPDADSKIQFHTDFEDFGEELRKFIAKNSSEMVYIQEIGACMKTELAKLARASAPSHAPRQEFDRPVRNFNRPARVPGNAERGSFAPRRSWPEQPAPDRDGQARDGQMRDGQMRCPFC